MFADRTIRNYRTWQVWISQSDPLRVVIAAVVLVAIANGLAIRVATSFANGGPIGAVANTFEISAIVWCAVYVLYNLMLKADFGVVGFIDIALILLAVLLILTPLTSFSWLALTVLSLYYILKEGVDFRGKRAMSLVLALCLSQQWAKWLNAIFLPTILDIDAMLVAAMSGYERYGNLVAAGDGTVTLAILEGCSSFANVSLAYLGWITARSYYGTSGALRGLLFSTASALAVVTINTTRIALIALRPDWYDVLHGPVGSFVANILSTATIFVVSYYGAQK